MNPSAKIRSNAQQAVPFFSVSDIEKSIRYYVDRLGFEMTNKWIDQASSDGVGFSTVAPRNVGHDIIGPDDYKIDFQSPTDVPEGTELADSNG